MAGAKFEILVDGKPRSCRDDKLIALQAGQFLKERHPTQQVTVRDLSDDSVMTIGWANGKAFVAP